MIRAGRRRVCSKALNFLLTRAGKEEGFRTVSFLCGQRKRASTICAKAAMYARMEGDALATKWLKVADGSGS